VWANSTGNKLNCNPSYLCAMLKEKIKQLASEYAKDLVAIRHLIHANPELSYKEFETSKLIHSNCLPSIYHSM